MKGETTMEESLKMLVEYVLERCTGLEAENRRLEHQNTTLTEQNEHIMNDYVKQADKFAEVAKRVKEKLTFAKDGSLDYLYMNKDKTQELLDILRIKLDGKATC